MAYIEREVVKTNRDKTVKRHNEAEVVLKIPQSTASALRVETCII